MVDEELVLQGHYRSGRLRCYLHLAPGLQVRVGSRCVNKRRVAVISIRCDDLPDPDPEYPLYRHARRAMQPGCVGSMGYPEAHSAALPVDA